MKLDAVRKFALALPGTTEEPHHQYGSFRVHGKIFATFPPDQQHLHVFVPETRREEALALYPHFVEKLLWGEKVAGLKITLAKATAAAVESLLRHAWDDKATKPRKPRAGVGRRSPEP